MSKKHFRALAASLHGSKPLRDCSKDAHYIWDCAVRAVADVCAQANPNFNREKFLTACREGL